MRQPDPPGPVPLESVITTAELERRPARPPDFEAEIRALQDLMEAIAEASGPSAVDAVLRSLAEIALTLCRAHSAGVSLLEVRDGREVFRCRAAAGAWTTLVGESMPREASPCGAAIDRDRALLMSYPERHFQFPGDAPPLAELLLIPFRREGIPAGTVWVMAHDRTRQFDAEDRRLLTGLARLAAAAHRLLATGEQLESDHGRDRFLATLAHELRNPLAPVRNAVEILRLKAPPSPEVQWARDIIDRQTRTMTRMIDDLLDVSRIARDKLELRKERTEIAGVVRAAIETVRPAVERGRHGLSVTLPAEPVIVNADPARLAQVFANLLRNAVKYSAPDGPIDLYAERSGNDVVVSVRDRGIGIAGDMLPRVFDAFTRAEPSAGRGRGGLGIGLTLVKRLVEMHGGSVTAASRGMGAGSEFVVRLPVVTEAPAVPASAPPHAAPASGKRRVLVVDDNHECADSLGYLIRMLGYETHISYDGVEALEFAVTLRPEIALLDLGMPGMNGLELARRIRGQPWGRDATLIAVTGWGSPEDKRRTAAAGFDHHLVKPADPAEVETLLASPRRPERAG